MGKPVKTIVNFKTTGGLNSSEMTFNVPDAITNGTIDLEQRNYEELSLEIWTGPGSTGTQLIKDTDFSASLRNDFVSDKSGEEIYSGILIINATYQDVDLYIPINTLDMFGDFIDKSDLNRIVPSYDLYDIPGGTGQVHALPDATGDIGEQTIEREGAGAGVVTFTTVSGQTINSLIATKWNLEGVGEITFYPYQGNWRIKSYRDLIKIADGTSGSASYDDREVRKYADGSAEVTGIYSHSSINLTTDSTSWFTTSADLNAPYGYTLITAVKSYVSPKGSAAPTAKAGQPTTTTVPLRPYRGDSTASLAIVLTWRVLGTWQ